MAASWNTFSRRVNRILPNAVTKEKAAEIAADFMTTFYQVQIGALELLNDTEGQKEEPGFAPGSEVRRRGKAK